MCVNERLRSVALCEREEWRECVASHVRDAWKCVASHARDACKCSGRGCVRTVTECDHETERWECVCVVRVGLRRVACEERDAKSARAPPPSPRSAGGKGATRARRVWGGRRGLSSPAADWKTGAHCARVGRGGLMRGVVARWQQIIKTKPESQRIVTTRPLCRVQ